MEGKKAMACTLCGISVFLLIAAIFNADWANSDGWREGLFLQCVDKDISTPLPFNQPIEMAGSDGCHSRVKCNQGKCIQDNAAQEENADKPQKVKYGDKEIEVVEYMPEYMKKVLILLVIGLLLDIGGTVFTGMGAKSDDKEKIQRYNKLAIILFVGSCILLLIVAIVYSTSFTAEQQAENVKYDGYKLQFGEKIKIEETEDLIIDSSSTSTNDTTNDDVPPSLQSKVGEAREFSFGFCYGVVCVSIIFLIISIALLVLEHFRPDTVIVAEGEGQEA